MWVYVSHPASPTVTQTVRQTVTPTDCVSLRSWCVQIHIHFQVASVSPAPDSWPIFPHLRLLFDLAFGFSKFYSSLQLAFFLCFFFLSFLTSMTLHKISTLWLKSRLISHNRKWGSDVPKAEKTLT